MFGAILFGLLAIVSIASALGMLLSRNAIYSALFLILNFATIAVFYILLNAPFLAMVQITVYAGAIMVLFLFVIMLLGMEQGPGVIGTRGWQLPLAIALGVGLVAAFVATVVTGSGGVGAADFAVEPSPTNLALRLFERYVFPFEVTGVLLLVAVVGLFIMSKKLTKG